MSSVNKSIIVGRLGKDPEITFMQSGVKIAKLSVATSFKYNDKQGNKQETTEWHKVAFFDKLADICSQYLKKGSLIYLEGRIETKKYTDNNGAEKYSTQIIGQTLQMLGSKQDGQQSNQQQEQQYAQASGGVNRSPPQQQGYQNQKIIPVSNLDDDIPF